MRMQYWKLAAALFVAVPLAAQAPDSAPRMAVVPSVVTSAQGEGRITPDRAKIIIGVETRASTARAAGADNARKQQAVIDTLKGLGIPAERIRSSEYTLYPERVYDGEGRNPRITGYVARNSVVVEVWDIARVGPAIDAALARGANNINSLQFESSKADSVRREALQEGVRLARIDAEAMARAAGRCISDVIELSTNEMMRPMMVEMQMARGAAADASTPIEPGEQTIAVNVTTRWRLNALGSACPQ